MADEQQLNEQPFLSHLLELRDRLMRMVLAILIVFLALFPFGNDIYLFIAEPLMAVLPEGTSMIATQVASPFLTPFKLALVAAVFLSMPYLLYQFWGFVAPGLYAHEKKLAFPMLASSIMLFYLGAAFAYFVVFPLVFAFLTSVAPEGVAVMTDITHYLDFVLTLFFAFGLSFEVPIATILLVAVGATTPDKLAHKRPYIIVGAFVIGMLLTPPDVISQTLLALPMWVLFEIGILFARPVYRRKQEKQRAEDALYEDDAQTTAATAGAGAAAGAGATPANAEAAAAEGDDEDDRHRFQPLTEEEMEAELDRIEAEYDDSDDVDYDEEEDHADGTSEEEKAAADESAADAYPDVSDSDEIPPDDDAELARPAEDAPVDRDARGAVVAKLERVMQLREEMRLDEARTLLYEVLVEGNETQVRVARNILEQLDS